MQRVLVNYTGTTGPHDSELLVKRRLESHVAQHSWEKCCSTDSWPAHTHDYAALVHVYDEHGALVESGRDVIDGRTAIGMLFADKFRAFPDLQVNYTHVVASDAVGMAEGRIQATHIGCMPRRPASDCLQQAGRWTFPS